LNAAKCDKRLSIKPNYSFESKLWFKTLNNMVYFLKQRKTEPERKIKNKRKINFLGKERGTPPSPKKDLPPVRGG
jgi:hypothetical protein